MYFGDQKDLCKGKDLFPTRNAPAGSARTLSLSREWACSLPHPPASLPLHVYDFKDPFKSAFNAFFNLISLV